MFEISNTTHQEASLHLLPHQHLRQFQKKPLSHPRLSYFLSPDAPFPPLPAPITSFSESF